VAINVDPVETNKRHCGALGFTFPVLSDPDAAVIRRYGLLHPGGGPKKTDIARPAEFLVDASGTINWANLTHSVTVRARPEQVIKTFDEQNGKTSR